MKALKYTCFLLFLAGTNMPMLLEAEETPLVCHLRLIFTNITAREPTFELTVSNRSSGVVRILDLDRRTDLQHNYAEILVESNGVAIYVPKRISDPGSLSSAKYLRLKPGDSKRFVITSPKLFQRLPGTYTLQASYRFEPLHPERAVLSDKIEAAFPMQRKE